MYFVLCYGIYNDNVIYTGYASWESVAGTSGIINTATGLDLWWVPS